MHESTLRLLDFAKKATARQRDPIRSFADLAKRMKVSSARITNWKQRGVSKEGAIAAEKLFGCSAQSVLYGTPAQIEPQPIATPPITAGQLIEPPPPPADFADRREATESGWNVLEDLKDMPSSERNALVAEIHARAENYRTFMRETIARHQSLASKPQRGKVIDSDESQPQEGGKPRGTSVWGELGEEAGGKS